MACLNQWWNMSGYLKILNILKVRHNVKMCATLSSAAHVFNQMLPVFVDFNKISKPATLKFASAIAKTSFVV